MMFQVDPITAPLMGEAFKYGLPGIMLIVFLYALIYLLREHRTEREQWRVSFDTHSKQMSEAVMVVGTAVSELKGTVGTLCSMLAKARD